MPRRRCDLGPQGLHVGRGTQCGLLPGTSAMPISVVRGSRERERELHGHEQERVVDDSCRSAVNIGLSPKTAGTHTPSITSLSLGQLASVGRRAVCKSCDCARRRATSTTMAATQCPSSNRAVVGSLPARRRSQKRRLPPGPPVRLQSHGPRIRPGPKCLGLPAHPHGPAGRPTSGVTGGQPGRGVVGGWRSLRVHLVLDPGGKLVWDGGHGCVAQQVAGQPRVTIR